MISRIFASTVACLVITVVPLQGLAQICHVSGGPGGACLPANGLPNATNQHPNQSLPPTVLQNPQVYIVFWGWGAAQDSQGEIGPALDFLSYIGGSKYLNTVVQYTGANGLVAGNPNGFFSNTTGPNGRVWYDTTNPPPATWITDNTKDALHQPWQYTEVTAAYNYFNITNPDAIVILSMSPSIAAPGGFCGFHSSDSLASTTPVSFIVYPYQNNCGNFGNLCKCYAAEAGYYTPTFQSATTVTLLHELGETITDPRGDLAQGGWTTPNGEVGETACCTPVKMPISPTSDYYVPGLWSNAANIAQGAQWNNGVLSRATRISQFTVLNGQIYAAWGDPDTFSASSVPAWVLINQNEPAGLSFANMKVGVASWKNNRIDLFAWGTDGNLWHPYWYGNSSGGGGTWIWENFGVPGPNCYGYPPGVASTRPYYLDVAVVCYGTEHLWFRRYINTGGWENWQDLGTAPGQILNSGPAMTSWGATAGAADPRTDGRLDIFVTDLNGELLHLSSDSAGAAGSWSAIDNRGSPTSCQGNLIGSPDAASWGLNRLDVVVYGCGQVQHLWWAPYNWIWDTNGINGNGYPGGNYLGGAPSVSEMGDNRLWVSALDSSGYVWTYGYDIGNGWRQWVQGAYLGTNGISSSSW